MAKLRAADSQRAYILGSCAMRQADGQTDGSRCSKMPHKGAGHSKRVIYMGRLAAGQLSLVDVL